MGKTWRNKSSTRKWDRQNRDDRANRNKIKLDKDSKPEKRFRESSEDPTQQQS